MRLNKTLTFAIDFARCSEEYSIPPVELAQLIAYAEMSKTAYEREQFNSEQDNATKADRIANAHGCALDWPGLWPCIQKFNEPRTNRLVPAPN